MKIYKSEMRTVSINNNEISYILNIKDVKNINLRIDNNGSISVSANRKVSALKVDNFVKSKEIFIVKCLKKIEKAKIKRAIPCELSEGKSVLLLGKWFTLRISEGENEKVIKFCDELILILKDRENFKRKEMLLNRFLKEQCNKVFEFLVLEVLEQFKIYSVKMPIIKVRKMKARWGSCRPQKGIITLNSVLIYAPLNCIKYVVVHEFCHFIHPNHKKQFYLLLSEIMPCWKEQKKLLEEFQSTII